MAVYTDGRPHWQEGFFGVEPDGHFSPAGFFGDDEAGGGPPGGPPPGSAPWRPTWRPRRRAWLLLPAVELVRRALEALAPLST